MMPWYHLSMHPYKDDVIILSTYYWVNVGFYFDCKLKNNNNNNVFFFQFRGREPQKSYIPDAPGIWYSTSDIVPPLEESSVKLEIIY